MGNSINMQNQTDNNISQNNDVIDLLPLIKAVWRKKWSIISLVFIVMLLTTLIVMSITPTYQATATIQIDPKENKVVSFDPVYGLSNDNDYLITQFQLLQSRVLAERVVKKLNLTTNPEFDPRQQKPPLIDIKGFIKSFNLKQFLPGQSPEDLAEKPLTEQEILDSVVNKFMKRVSISPIKKSQLANISVQMADPKLATLAANEIGKEFIKSQLDAAMEDSLTATKWMNERLVDIKEKLQKSEDKLQAYKEKEGLIDVKGVVTISANELSAINQRLVDARSKRAEAESQYNQVRNIKKDDWKRLSTVPAVLSHPLIQTFKADEAKARAKVEELSKRYGKKHPAMQAALSDLNAAQTSLKTQVQQIVAGIQKEYQIASANERSLQKSVNENKEQIKEISKDEYKLRALQLEVDSNQAVFDTFINRLKETTATADIETTNARIVDPAVIPTQPIKPKKSLIIVLAGLLSGMLAVFLILLLNALNNTFKSTDEIEMATNLPVLGVVPLIVKKPNQHISQMYHKATDKIFSEAIKTIRTGVTLSAIEKPHKIIVITSSIPGEGKTSLSVNLSDALRENEKVLLIEADMRRPNIARSFGLPPGTPGLANLIAGTATQEEAIQSLYGGIDTMVAGVVPPNPLELLSTEKFKRTLQELSVEYDRIIIDSPPVQAVSDALLLSTFADAVLYVVKAESTSKDLVKKGIGKLLQHRAPMQGTILNQVDIKKAKKHGYGYDGYYDYYGYSKS
ncbi:polysaccharide biosynthesis tyrosine autokinase [Thiomicrorhabdus sp.]|uniref:GumC family protein n=1 Tax=Thiomicrorhabdus sp. TaxID=2039724 RepID=UPI002AA76EC2|nr:polysaccharide biosynthesis tyrosine autokinase [Thiomicrorhabdus sp.]